MLQAKVHRQAGRKRRQQELEPLKIRLKIMLFFVALIVGDKDILQMPKTFLMEFKTHILHMVHMPEKMKEGPERRESK